MNAQKHVSRIYRLMLAHRGLSCAAIVLAAFFIAVLMMVFRPRAVRKPLERTKMRAVVEVITPKDYRVDILAMGEVMAKREINLFPQVSGQVVKIAEGFDEGTLVRAGDVLLEIEKADYQMQFDMAEANYEKELGRQSVAKKEYDYIRTKVADKKQTDSYLALRGPELKTAKANLETARLNLMRTVVKAPFDALVLDKSVDVGQQINTQTMLAKLYSSDVFRIEASVPVNKLKWLKGYADDKEIGKAYIYKTEGEDTIKREAEVVRVLSALQNNSYMGQIILEIKNPLDTVGQNSSPLFLGSYVNISIAGKILKDAYRIPRKNMHQGDVLWFDNKGKLGIRKLDIIYRDRDYVYFKDTDTNIRLITNNITTPYPGVDLKVVEGENE